jgi:hypothetical protein
VDSRAGLDGCEKYLAPKGIRSPDGAVHSKSRPLWPHVLILDLYGRRTLGVVVCATRRKEVSTNPNRRNVSLAEWQLSVQFTRICSSTVRRDVVLWYRAAALLCGQVHALAKTSELV